MPKQPHSLSLVDEENVYKFTLAYIDTQFLIQFWQDKLKKWSNFLRSSQLKENFDLRNKLSDWVLDETLKKCLKCIPGLGLY